MPDRIGQHLRWIGIRFALDEPPHPPERLSGDECGIRQRRIQLSVTLEEESPPGLEPIGRASLGNNPRRHARRCPAQVNDIALDDVPGLPTRPLGSQANVDIVKVSV